MAQSPATRRRFRPGDVLISTSEHGSDAYIIERGEVGVWRETDTGRTLLARLGDGQMVGELSLIDGEGRTATVTALTECTVRVVTAEDLTNHLEGVHPIVHTLIDALLERIRANDRAARGYTLPGLPQTPEGIASSFDDAVTAGALQLLYEPVISIDGGATEQVRATVTWFNTGDGRAPAAELLKTEPAGHTLAEVTSWYLLRATADLAALRRRTGVSSVAVALSEHQLMGDALVDDVFGAISNACIAPEALMLELHEADLPEPGSLIAERLSRCVQGGVRLAIRHFGSRLGPIQRLVDLPISEVLIDPNMLRDADHAEQMLHALVAIADRADLTLIAQDLQTDEQVDRARRAGIQTIHRKSPLAGDGAGIRSVRSSLEVTPEDGLVIDGVADQPSSLAG